MSFIIVADDDPLRARLNKMIPAWTAPIRSHIQSLNAVLRRSFPIEPDPANGGGLLERGAALAGAGAWECDLDTNVLTWTDAVFDVFGLPRGARISREDTVALYSEESREEMERLRANAIARNQSFTMDAKIFRPDGRQRWMRLTAGVMSREGRPTHLYGLKQDITQEREMLEELRKAADQDALTGLDSRRVFQSRFLNASAAARANFPVGTLVLFDVDGFKQINDEYGHAAGDACLKAVAVRLAWCFPDAVMIARIGGDEFAVLLRNPVGEHLSQRVAAGLSRLANPVSWNGQLIHVSASAGMAASHDQWTYDPDNMFSAADAALYEAKRAGRNRMHLAAA
jgi:diguanylate cyclase (GGDEF)-like protein/PAS domain S-box-containing protein